MGKVLEEVLGIGEVEDGFFWGGQFHLLDVMFLDEFLGEFSRLIGFHFYFIVGLGEPLPDILDFAEGLESSVPEE